jgi:hypothetical protein
MSEPRPETPDRRLAGCLLVLGIMLLLPGLCVLALEGQSEIITGLLFLAPAIALIVWGIRKLAR